MDAYVVGLSGVIDISAAIDHTCALLQDGTVYCWGSDFFGQLGGGSSLTRTPVKVPGLSGVTSISADYSRTCAVVGGGAVYCWGRSIYGELSVISYRTPKKIEGLTGVAAIDLGAHACAVLEDGTVSCWGDYYGRSSSGYDHKYFPEAIEGLNGVTAISAGGTQSCAVVEGNSAHCWGFNHDGQLGDGTTIHRSAPVHVAGLGTG